MNRIIVQTDSRVIAINDMVQSALDNVANIPKNIMNQLLLEFITRGLRIGRWSLGEDTSGNFQVTDTSRGGYYRMVKTQDQLTVLKS